MLFQLQEDFDTLRPLCYTHTDVFLVCFNVVSPRSLQNVRKKWLPEIRRTFQGSDGSMPPFILVGTQSDLRHDVKVLIELNAIGLEPIPASYARALAHKLGAISYIECSALTQKNLKVNHIRLNRMNKRMNVRGEKKKETRSKRVRNTKTNRLNLFSFIFFFRQQEVFDTAILSALDYQKQVKSISNVFVRSDRQKLISQPNNVCARKVQETQHYDHKIYNLKAQERQRSTTTTTTAVIGNKSMKKKYCAHCSKPISRKVITGDAGKRSAAVVKCTSCQTNIHNQLNAQSQAHRPTPQPSIGGRANNNHKSNASNNAPLKHYLPVDRMTTANISDAKLVGWRKSLTKLSAQEALENESRRRLEVADDDDDDVHKNEDDRQHMIKTGGSDDATRTKIACTNINVFPGGPNGAPAARVLSDGEDQGFHDDEGGVEVDEEPVYSEDHIHLNQSSSNYHYFYNPAQSSKWLSPSKMLTRVTNQPPTASVYHYYKNRPLPNQPQMIPSKGLLELNPDYQTPFQPDVKSPVITKTPGRLQTFFQNFGRHSSSSNSSSSLSQPKGVTDVVDAKPRKNNKENNLALRSSSFFFLSSNAIKKNKPKAKKKNEKASDDSLSCSTLSSQSSRNFFAEQQPGHSTRSKPYGSEFLQMMSNSVTELRNRKSFFKKLISSSITSSSSPSSSASSSAYSNCSTDNEKSRLKSKKLKDLYHYDYNNDYEEIDNDRQSSRLFSCCLPF